jgi:aldehyde:ferredoxin oxidoreductase
MCQFGSTLEHIGIANRITGTSRGTDPLFYEGKAKLVTYHEEVCCASDCLGVCFMHTLSSHRVTPELLAEMFEAATGISMDVEKLLRAGERVINLERIFNVHRGLGRADDTLPSRFFEEMIPGGPGKGRKIDRKRFNQLLQEFYHLRGWDANGIPTEKRLRMLGLSDLSLPVAK